MSFTYHQEMPHDPYNKFGFWVPDWIFIPWYDLFVVQNQNLSLYIAFKSAENMNVLKVQAWAVEDSGGSWFGLHIFFMIY